MNMLKKRTLIHKSSQPSLGFTRGCVKCVKRVTCPTVFLLILKNKLFFYFNFATLRLILHEISHEIRLSPRNLKVQCLISTQAVNLITIFQLKKKTGDVTCQVLPIGFEEPGYL